MKMNAVGKPITYDNLSPAMRAFLGAFEGFRQWGFASKDIFLLVAPDGRNNGHPALFLLLKTQGKQFSVSLALLEEWQTEAVVLEEYTWYAEHATEISQADADRIWHESVVYKNAMMEAMILAKGIRIPRALS